MDGERLLRELPGLRTVAVVGCSPKPERPSHAVAEYLQSAGFRVIPVNPGCSEILGERCYPSLLEVPLKIDLVDVFRRSENVPDVVDQAIRVGARAVWMQDGVVHEAAAAKAEKAGLMVVMDDCLMRVHYRSARSF